ncbi:LamG-like jellyroll fold domain-containing protein [Bdellovibrio sp. HCB288]|uniref:LamG-like jellyroll fold domain-containing protein n=1 Tax=Bdellovibrio sp. HCB288 TaxID=3394355 RepID=UPI0039B41A44
MKYKFGTFLILAFAVTGCSNPLGDSSKADSAFSPGYESPATPAPTPPAPTPTPSPTPSPTPVAVAVAVVTDPTDAVADNNLSMTVQMKDSGGNDIATSGVVITAALSAGPSGAVLEGTTTATTNASGQAVFTNLRIKKAGSGYVLTASSSGYTSDTSSTFAISPDTVSASTSLISASVANILPDGVDASVVTVTLKDAHGNTISGQSVTLATGSTGAAITQPSAVTNASGVTTGSVTGTTAGSKVISISNPVGLSSLTATVTVQALSLNQTWNFNSANSAGYTLSDTSLEYTASLLRLRDLSVDNSNDASFGFGAAASTTNTTWTSPNGLHLNATGMSSGSGSLTSRHFTSAANMAWTGLSFTSLIPAGKKLPNNRGIETGYGSGNVDMSSNLLLLHLDENSWAGGATYDVTDSSGRGHTAKITGAVSVSSSGKLGNSANLNGGYIEVPSHTELSGMADMTFEAWIKPAVGAINGNPAPLASYRVGSGGTNYAFAIFAYTSKYLNIDINSSTNRYTSTYVVLENVWQHITVTFKGATKVLTLYVNGVSVWSQTTSQSAIATPDPTQASFYIGAMKSNTNYYRGLIDEVAFYSRTLGSTEILDRYQRGAMRSKFQVRACTSSCTTEPFVGPDGLSTSFYSEFNNTTLSNITNLTIPGFTAEKDFQYKATLETDSVSLTPKISSVSVTPVVYSILSPSVTSSEINYSYLHSFATSSSGTGGVKYQLLRNGNPYYHDGSAWVAASGSLTANTVSEVNANIKSFHRDVGTGALKIRAYFTSGIFGTDPMSLSNAVVTGIP